MEMLWHTWQKQSVLCKIKVRSSRLNHQWSGPSPGSPLGRDIPYLCMSQAMGFGACPQMCLCQGLADTQHAGLLIHLLLRATASVL